MVGSRVIIVCEKGADETRRSGPPTEFIRTTPRRQVLTYENYWETLFNSIVRTRSKSGRS